MGVTCALLVSVLGISTIAVAPHAASSIQWTIPGGNLSANSVYRFEVAASHAVAGYLLILIIFPFLGAGIGAWGGLFAEGNRGLRPGGGGGGGTKPPRPKTPRPGGGLLLDGSPPFTAASLLSLPEWDPATGAARVDHAAPERIPASQLHRAVAETAARDQLLGDDVALDLVRALADDHQRGVPEVALDVELG